MIRVGILGATGYTALELLKILLRHPGVKITTLTTRQEEEPHLAEVHRQLTGRLDLRLRNLTPSQVAEEVDCAFCCLPHAASAAAVSTLLEGGARVIDLSADYRLDSAAVYEQWYGVTHPDAPRLGSVPYGLPELFKEEIQPAELVANPGCYPTTAILALAPFLRAGWIEPREVIIDAKSGVSGGGRTPKLGFHFPECNESVSAYGVGGHRHTPEIEQVLSRVAGGAVEVIFTPHLIPMDRGMLSVCYARPTRPVSEREALDLLRASYADCPFVRVVEHLPGTKDTVHTNFCDITARVVRGRLLLLSALDNLVKGASGAAAQNFNLMFGFEETTALL